MYKYSEGMVEILGKICFILCYKKDIFFDKYMLLYTATNLFFFSVAQNTT
jgi:hypothetical protein